MYSVVLMMALTTGGDLPAHHRGGCSGGSGCCGTYAAACWGGCGGGCWCGHARHHRGRRHRSGGCCGTVSNCGCCGGGWGYGCTGGCWGGCTGSVGGGWGGCTGGTVIGPVISGPATPPPPAPPAPGPKPERVGPPRGTMAPAPAVIIVSLPAEARLKVNDYPTRSTSNVRTFSSPELQPGQAYRYTLTGELVRDGKTLKTTREVTVRAGEETRVALDFGARKLVQK